MGEMTKTWIAMMLGGLMLAGCGVGGDGILLWPCSTEESFEANDKCANGEEGQEVQIEETAGGFEPRVSLREFV